MKSLAALLVLFACACDSGPFHHRLTTEELDEYCDEPSIEEHWAWQRDANARCDKRKAAHIWAEIAHERMLRGETDDQIRCVFLSQLLCDDTNGDVSTKIRGHMSRLDCKPIPCPYYAPAPRKGEK